MSKLIFEAAANNNFESLRKVELERKKEKNLIPYSFEDKKVYLNKKNINNNNNEDIVKSIIERNKAFINEKINEKTKINKLKTLEKENIIESTKGIKNKNKILENEEKKSKPKLKKIIINKVKNMKKNKKIECLDNEKIINIKLKQNPRNNLNSINITDKMYQTEKTGFKYCLNNFDRMSNNYLTARKTLELFNQEEKKKINHKLGNNPNSKNSKLNYIEPNNEQSKTYSKYYLPSSGYWLNSKQ